MKIAQEMTGLYEYMSGFDKIRLLGFYESDNSAQDEMDILFTKDENELKTYIMLRTFIKEDIEKYLN